MEHQRWNNAEAMFDEAVRARPYDASLVFERGRFHADRSRPAKADEDFVRAYILGGRDPNLLTTICENQNSFRRAVALAPGHAAPLFARQGDHQAYRRHWAQAAAAYEQAVRLEPEELASRRCQILSLLADGQIDQARGACSDLLDRFGTTTDPETAGLVAWYSAMAPGVNVHLAVPVRLAELALGSAPEAKKHDALNTLGAALYRAGRFEEAIRRLQEGAKRGGGTYFLVDWPFLALAHHRLGHFEEAHRWLDRFRDYGPDKAPGEFWHALQIDLLRSEAEAVVLWDPIFPADPFVR